MSNANLYNIYAAQIAAAAAAQNPLSGMYAGLGVDPSMFHHIPVRNSRQKLMSACTFSCRHFLSRCAFNRALV